MFADRSQSGWTSFSTSTLSRGDIVLTLLGLCFVCLCNLLFVLSLIVHCFELRSVNRCIFSSIKRVYTYFFSTWSMLIAQKRQFNPFNISLSSIAHSVHSLIHSFIHSFIQRNLEVTTKRTLDPIVNSRFLQRPQERSRGNQSIHRHFTDPSVAH